MNTKTHWELILDISERELREIQCLQKAHEDIGIEGAKKIEIISKVLKSVPSASEMDSEDDNGDF